MSGALPDRNSGALRTLILNTADGGGGAAIAMRRVHTALRAQGVDSRMLVQRKRDADPSVFQVDVVERVGAAWRRHLDRRSLARYPGRGPGLFSPASGRDRVDLALHHGWRPDVVHLSWVNSGFVGPESLPRFGRPIVWTLHDMWPFTGGCHYDGGCGAYRGQCGRCPVLGSQDPDDVSSGLLSRKRSAWSGLRMQVVAPSRWLAQCARDSALFSHARVHVIPNCIDHDVFRPTDRRKARAQFGLDPDRPALLFAALGATSDPRKGFRRLVGALEHLAAMDGTRDLQLIVLGSAPIELQLPGTVRARFIPHIGEPAEQARLYGACDAFVAPSLQENFANTVVESLACGTPVCAFDVGGMPDLVSHRRNGWLARSFDEQDLAAGIDWALRQDAPGLRKDVRDSVVAQCDPARVASAYEAVYREALSGETGMPS